MISNPMLTMFAPSWYPIWRDCEHCLDPAPGRICYSAHKICEGGVNEMADLRKTFKKGTAVKVTSKFFEEYSGRVSPDLVQGKTYRVARHYGGIEAILMDPETGKELNNTGSVRFTNLELASREEHAKTLLEEASELQVKVNKLKEKAANLLKYKSDDEEAAAIISEIVKSNGDQALILEIIRSNGIEINLVK